MNAIQELVLAGGDVYCPHEKGCFPLLYAVTENKIEILNYFLRTPGVIVPSRPSAEGTRSIIHQAVLYSSLPTLKLLLNAGFSASARIKNDNLPVHYFCKRQFPADSPALLNWVLDRLLLHSNINVTNGRHETPLHQACLGSCDEVIIRYLLDHGADPNALSNSWDTPLSLCIIGNRPASTLELIKVCVCVRERERGRAHACLGEAHH